MTLDSLIEADILSTCSALGTEIRGEYQKSTDCLNCLRDLLRYLRRDDENHSVLRQLGSLKLLQTDLLPILKKYDKESEIIDLTLRLLVALTNPAILLFNENVPEDKLTCNVYLQLVSYLQGYKKAFTDTNVWKILSCFLKEILKKTHVERREEENMTVERILIIIRNVLHVPPDGETFKRTDDDISIHDQILRGLHITELDLILLYLASKEDENQFCLHVLEIISLMLREQKPDILLQTGDPRSKSEKEKDEKMLIEERIREQQLKLRKTSSFTKSRFNGVYYVKNMKSISDKDYIAHKLITNFDSLKFDTDKNKKRKAKNRLPVLDLNMTRRSTLCIRLFLKNFCMEFLKSYNDFLASVRRSLLNKRSEEHDDSYYLWTMRFFMEFNRHSNFQAAYVSETISIQIFHYIQTQIDTYREMLLTDKKKIKYWSKRMHLGLGAYKELLETLNAMDKSSDENIRRAADIISSNVFYVIEYREMLLSLLLNFEETRFSLAYLAELVEATHLFLKMLEHHSKKHKVIIQKKKRKLKKKNKKPSYATRQPVNSEEELNADWDIISSDLLAAIQGKVSIPEDVTPFDAASNISFEEQKMEAVYKIRDALVDKEEGKAVAFLRAARNLWPDGDSFGAADIKDEDEILVLKEIFYSNLQRNSVDVNAVHSEVELSEENEEEEDLPCIAEQQLNLDDVYKRYASPKVVQPCCLLLENYEKNSPRTNLSLLKVLYRISWNCKMHGLFFQASLFLTFQKIFKDPSIHSDPVMKEMYKFSKFILRKFFEVGTNNDKIFLEMLFWKGPKEAYELEEGYGKTESSSSKLIWTEDEEEELKYLYEENKNIHIEGQDVVDIILANLNKSRTRKQVVSKLQNLSLIKNAQEIKMLQNEWQEAEIVELQELYGKFKNSKTLMSDILENLTIKRSRHATVNKLLELNIIQDRKEVRKGKVGKGAQRPHDSDSSDSESSEDMPDCLNDALFGNMPDHQESNNENEEIIVKNMNNDWDEEEIMKLHHLFQKNQESSHIVKDIANEFTARSTKEIKKKLREMNLLPDKSEKSKKSSKQKKTENGDLKVVRKRAPKEWNEEEIQLLKELFEQHKSDDDIIGNIINHLNIKRSKQKIIEKLLELGIIKDKKEVRKKKKSNNTSKRKLTSNSINNNELVSDEGQDSSDGQETFALSQNSIQDSLSSNGTSSEDDIPLNNFVPASQTEHNSSIRRKKRKRLVVEDSDVEENNLLSQTLSLNKNSVDSDNGNSHVEESFVPLERNASKKSSSIQRKKRKRLILAESDDESIQSDTNDKEIDNISNIHEPDSHIELSEKTTQVEPIEGESFYLTLKKKKLHVLEDSDASE